MCRLRWTDILIAALAAGIPSARAADGEAARTELDRLVAAFRTDPGRVPHLSSSGDALVALGGEAAPAIIELAADADSRLSLPAWCALRRIGEAAFPALVRALEHPSVEVRKSAVQGLARLGPRARVAYPGLIRLLGADDLDLRRAAAEALSRLGPLPEEHLPAVLAGLRDESIAFECFYAVATRKAAALPILLGRLEEPNGELRQHAVHALGLLGEEARPAVPEVLKMAVGDPWGVVRDEAIETLGRMRPDARAVAGPLTAAFRELCSSADAEDWYQVRGLADLLGSLRPVVPEVAEALAAAARDAREPIQEAGVGGLHRIGRDAVEAAGAVKEALRAALAAGTSDSRCVAALALAEIDPTAESARDIAACLSRRNQDVVSICCTEALGTIGPRARAEVPALAKASLRFEDYEDLECVRDALVRIEPGCETALPILVEALGDRREVAMDAAGWLLRSLPAPVGAAALAAALGDSRLEVRLGAADAARSARGEARTVLVPAIVARLVNPRERRDVKEALLIALIWLGREEPLGDPARDAVPFLLRRLQGRPDDLDGTIAALGAVGPPAAPSLDVLVRVAGDDGRGDCFLRENAVEAIGKLGDAAAPAVPLLLRLLDSTEEEIAPKAAVALGRIGPAARSAVPRLLEALRDRSAEEPRGTALCVAAAQALGRLGDEQAVPVLAAALADPGEGVAPAAAGALRDLGPRAAEAVPALVAYLRRGPAEGALEALAAIGPAAREAIPSVAECLEGGGESKAAAAALGRIAAGDRRAVSALESSLLDPFPRNEFGDVFLEHALAAVESLEILSASLPQAIPVLEAVERGEVRLVDWQVESAGKLRDAARDALARTRAR